MNVFCWRDRPWRCSGTLPRFYTAAAVLLALLLAARANVAWPDEPASSTSETGIQPPKSFLRLTRDDQKSPVALETAIVRYCDPSDAEHTLTVDLVAAVHIAEKSYYEQLNREFATYDAVLYELVASDDHKVPQPGESGGNHPLSLFQNGMKDLLGLEFQLKGIDYTCKNLVHADMSPDDFARSMRDRGESVASMFMRMLGYAMARQNQSSDTLNSGQLLLALLDKNRAFSMKRAMATQFEEGDGSLAALDGPNGSTLISGRNQVALDVLREQIDAGKKTIAIFYGAGHMPDMQKRLHDDFSLDPVSARWLVAWNLKSDTQAANPPLQSDKPAAHGEKSTPKKFKRDAKPKDTKSSDGVKRDEQG